MKYSLWDILFSRFKWYRKITGLYWAKDPAHYLANWVKFSDAELKRLTLHGIHDGPY